VYVRIVSFELSGVDSAAYRADGEKIVPAFLEWPGLISKTWLGGGPDGRHGGIYLFTDKSAADASRNTEIFRGMTANPHFAKQHIEEYEVLDELTALTRATPGA
jgi:hypothetical protein